MSFKKRITCCYFEIQNTVVFSQAFIYIHNEIELYQHMSTYGDTSSVVIPKLHIYIYIYIYIYTIKKYIYTIKIIYIYIYYKNTYICIYIYYIKKYIYTIYSI